LSNSFRELHQIKDSPTSKVLKEIRCYTLDKCTQLQTIIIENVTSIGKGEFKGTSVSAQSTQGSSKDPDFLYRMGKKYLKGME